LTVEGQRKKKWNYHNLKKFEKKMFTQVSERLPSVGHHGGGDEYHRPAGDLLWHQQQQQQRRRQQGELKHF